MGQILQFKAPIRVVRDSEEPALDLLSAVDFALRDLADIAASTTQSALREQAQACIAMLQDAYIAEFEHA